MKLKALETGKLEFVNVKAKLEKLAGDSWVANNTPHIAENILKNYSTKILSNSQLDLINSIITQYAGR